MKIPFNKPYLTGNEIVNISNAIQLRKLAGDGEYTRKCNSWLEENLSCKRALLTHSGTAALEMAALLLDLEAGDEVIMPSFTFVSTANAFVLRGAVPVFVDIREDTLNIDETLIEAAITPKTKAIVIVHYAGASCEMDVIMEIAKKYSLVVIEDAAQALLSTYKGKKLGTIGDLGCLSFHETKNIISGEGGALLINNIKYVERAEIIREKGTNRTQYFRGQVDKYTWVDIGSSYLPSELIAAFLYAQLNEAEFITEKRIKNWNTYHDSISVMKNSNKIRIPQVNKIIGHNGHLFYIIFESLELRTKFIDEMNKFGINCVFHYIPLHNAKEGKRITKVIKNLENTEKISERLVRLPLWVSMDKEIKFILERIEIFLTDL